MNAADQAYSLLCDEIRRLKRVIADNHSPGGAECIAPCPLCAENDDTIVLPSTPREHWRDLGVMPG